jgi:predicted O-methyltransferase YrrM
MKKIKNTNESLELVRKIAQQVPTFHHHYHILFDLANSFNKRNVVYCEIGAYCGASASLVLQRPNTIAFSIDIGEPASQKDVEFYVSLFNCHNNYYKYIKGDSRNLQTKELLVLALKEIEQVNPSHKIDILFIDGDHSYQAVIDDFNLYKDLIAKGGFIVFDDFNDSVHSPEVKKAVLDLMPYFDDFEIIGAFDNVLGAYPQELEIGNCFVIRKK